MYLFELHPRTVDPFDRPQNDVHRRQSHFRLFDVNNCDISAKHSRVERLRGFFRGWIRRHHHDTQHAYHDVPRGSATIFQGMKYV